MVECCFTSYDSHIIRSDYENSGIIWWCKLKGTVSVIMYAALLLWDTFSQSQRQQLQKQVLKIRLVYRCILTINIFKFIYYSDISLGHYTNKASDSRWSTQTYFSSWIKLQRNAANHPWNRYVISIYTREIGHDVTIVEALRLSSHICMYTNTDLTPLFAKLHEICMPTQYLCAWL